MKFRSKYKHVLIPKYQLHALYMLLATILLSLLAGFAQNKVNAYVDSKRPDYKALNPLISVKNIETIEVPVDNCGDDEKCKIYQYIVWKFKGHAADAITMIRKCENSTFSPTIVSPLNIQKSGRRSYDVGVMQINVDEANTVEIERLKDWKYNIDRGFKKYQDAGNTFRPWTCAHVIGQKNYLGK